MSPLKTREVARFLGLKTTQGVCALIALGKLPCERRQRFGKDDAPRFRYHIEPEELAAYLAAYDPALLPKLDAWLAKIQMQETQRTKAAA